jgi:hypothetical protein
MSASPIIRTACSPGAGFSLHHSKRAIHYASWIGAGEQGQRYILSEADLDHLQDYQFTHISLDGFHESEFDAVVAQG